MTYPSITRARDSGVAWLQAASVGAGLILLLARPALAASVGWSVPVVIVLFMAVLALGRAAPVSGHQAVRSSVIQTAPVVLIAGALIFVLGRLLSAGHSPAPATGLVIGLNSFAAIAEEALFRRAAYAALLPAGPVFAVAGSALLFGLAHVTVYGWWAFPLDVAAGLVLGWQRWASGTWAAPAVTHALADLLVVI
jgi:sodium transport system permease protein